MQVRGENTQLNLIPPKALTNSFIEFFDRATLTLTYTGESTDFYGLVIEQSGQDQSARTLEITGTGTLTLTNPGKATGKNGLSSNSSFYIGAYRGSPFQPAITIGGKNLDSEVPGNIDIKTYGSTGIAVQGGLFSYNCTNGSISIGGGGKNDEGMLTGDGLYIGIIAASHRSGINSDVDITAKNLSIFLSGTSPTENNNEMISSTVISLYNDGSALSGTTARTKINVNAETINLEIASSYKPYPDGTYLGGDCAGFGLYSQSGRYYESLITLSGKTFSFNSQTTESNFGIYMENFGQLNHISLDFDSITFSLNSESISPWYLDAGPTGGGISAFGLEAENLEDTRITMKARDTINLTNKNGKMVFNASAVVNIAAQNKVTISSGQNTAIHTTNYAESGENESGITIISGKGPTADPKSNQKWVEQWGTPFEINEVTITSSGEAENGYAIITEGNPDVDPPNGLTYVSGNNVVPCNINPFVYRLG